MWDTLKACYKLHLERKEISDFVRYSLDHAVAWAFNAGLITKSEIVAIGNYLNQFSIDGKIGLAARIRSET